MIRTAKVGDTVYLHRGAKVGVIKEITLGCELPIFVQTNNGDTISLSPYGWNETETTLYTVHDPLPLKNMKVGEWVWSPVYGWGEIIAVGKDYDARFHLGDVDLTFCHAGFTSGSVYPCIFKHMNQTLPDIHWDVPYDLKVDDLVVIDPDHCESDVTTISRVAGYNNEGELLVFKEGRCSKTSMHITHPRISVKQAKRYEET